MSSAVTSSPCSLNNEYALEIVVIAHTIVSSFSDGVLATSTFLMISAASFHIMLSIKLASISRILEKSCHQRTSNFVWRSPSTSDVCWSDYQIIFYSFSMICSLISAKWTSISSLSFSSVSSFSQILFSSIS